MRLQMKLRKHYEPLTFLLSFSTAAILGTFARQGVTQLANYKPSVVSPGSVLWSNMTSSILMGMLQVLKAHGWFTVEGLPPFFVALTTGFCGSFSSYSSMMLDTFLNSTSLTNNCIANSERLPNRAYGIMEFLAVLLANLFMSMCAHIFGREMASNIIIPSTSEIEDVCVDKGEVSKTVPKPWVYKTLRALHMLFILLAIPLIALLIVLACVYDNSSRGFWTLPPLFSVFGAYLRYCLSNWFNSFNDEFPCGTFAANQLAVVFIAIFQIITRGRRAIGQDLTVAKTVNQCRVISALSAGFSGGLSTVNTFINEGHKLKFINMLIYYAVSIAVSYSLLVIILGSYSWARGLVVPLC